MGRNLGNLEIKLFRFNHSVDYLPYYKSYTIEYAEDESVYDILNKINEYESFSYDCKERCNLNINNYFLNAEVLVSDVVKKVGNELQIDPISFYRVTNDLVINREDYDAKLALFDSYLTPEQKASFEDKYLLEYYASNTMLINKDYIGDHALLIADEIITNDPSVEQEILQLLTDKDNGILYHTSLSPRLLQHRYEVEEVFVKLLAKIELYKNITIVEKEKSDVPLDIEVSQYFKGFNIALYNTKGCLFGKVIEKSRAKYLHLDSRRDDLALHSVLVNEEFSLKIAGVVLLEAKDKNADFLIVQDEKDLAIFDAKQSKIAQIVNREIKLPVITQTQFEMLLQGEKESLKLGFDKHTVQVEFLEK